MTASNDLTSRIRSALTSDAARVQRLDLDGQIVWIKRKENLTLIRRLQKGNASRSFEIERAALHQLSALGVPVPGILDEGPDHIALADCGTPLDRILMEGIGSEAERLAIFGAAAEALADLHRRGLSHGRPALKDMCWNGRAISFVDFERYAAKRNTPRGHAMDLILFVFSGFHTGCGPSPEMSRAIAAYRARDPGGIWRRAELWCTRMRWIDWLTKPLQSLKNGKGREFKAIPLTLAVFTRGAA